ncbi:uncharacterized protein LOC115241141 [Formica exsecta]|uniref:uncharacterized protein LOC115241141 n=1 Tax=Formica exsecta TaxID=72781 RepID=UPI0011445A18|nr:uncharacterized protein LOC115241141 [Formica exsecta]
MIEESRQEWSKIEELESTFSELEAANNARIRDLQEKLRENERARHKDGSDNLEAGLAHMDSNQMDPATMNLKLKMANMKVAVYRSLYEARLNTYKIDTPIQSTRSLTDRPTQSRHTFLRSGKRKRPLLEINEECSSSDYSVAVHIARGDGEITNVTLQELPRFIRFSINNKSNKEISLSGWRINFKIGAFRKDFELNCELGVIHPLAVSVRIQYLATMLSPNSIMAADNITITLINNEGEVCITINYP